MELEIFYSAVLNFLQTLPFGQIEFLFLFFLNYCILQSLFWGVNDVIVVIGEEFLKFLKCFLLLFSNVFFIVGTDISGA